MSAFGGKADILTGRPSTGQPGCGAGSSGGIIHGSSDDSFAHAAFHLGVDQETCTALAKASLNGSSNLEQSISAVLIHNYKSVDYHVHEQIAQTITWLTLTDLSANATANDAKQVCSLLCDTFTKLTARQPKEYRLDRLQHLGCDVLRTRLPVQNLRELVEYIKQNPRQRLALLGGLDSMRNRPFRPLYSKPSLRAHQRNLAGM